MRKWLIVLVIILLALVAFLGFWEYTNISPEFIILTEDECVQKGGGVMNTLGEKTWNDEDVIGKTDGMRCPCLCIKK